MKSIKVKLTRFLLCLIIISLVATGCGIAASDDNSTTPLESANGEESDMSEEQKVELPFTPIERPALLADSMDAICEPVLSGDFIQSWFCKDWNVFEWTNYLKIIKSAGFEFVILQDSSQRQNGKYTAFMYPTKMAEDETISAADCKVYSDCVENLMKAAESEGLKVYIGIGGDDQWWSYAFKSLEWCENEAELVNRCVEDLYGLYKEAYPETFAGWYWSWEMFSAKDKHEVNWAKMINITLDKMTELDSSMPCIFSPFFSEYEDVGYERVLEEYSYLMENTTFREGDVFCPQDNIGIHSKEYKDANDNKGKYEITFMEQVIRSLKQATEKNPKVRFWLNIENFVGPNGEPAPIERYVDQMNIASKYAEKLITFSYAHYYNPLVVDRKYHQQYLQYLKWIEQNPKT